MQGSCISNVAHFW